MSDELKEEIERLRWENERLSDLVEAVKESRKEIDTLVEENLRLKRLLRSYQLGANED